MKLILAIAFGLSAEAAVTLFQKKIPDPTCKTGVVSVPNAAGTACCASYCGKCDDYPTCKKVRGFDSESACCLSKVQKAKSCDTSRPPCLMAKKAIPAIKSTGAAEDCGKAVKDWKTEAKAAQAAGKKAVKEHAKAAAAKASKGLKAAVAKKAAALAKAQKAVTWKQKLLAKAKAAMAVKKKAMKAAAAAAKAAFKTKAAKKKNNPKVAKPSYVLPGLPLKAAKRNVVTLDSAKWPKDYCVDVDLTFPAKANSNAYGYEGTIAMLGQVDICVTHTKKLLGGGTGFGVMAIEQSNGKGPYFATAGIIAPGSRQKLSFCYKESTNEPSFIVADKVQGGYLHNKKAKYPTTRNVKLSLFTGSHSSDTVEALKGGQLHSLQIRPFEPASKKAPKKKKEEMPEKPENMKLDLMKVDEDAVEENADAEQGGAEEEEEEEEEEEKEADAEEGEGDAEEAEEEEDGDAAEDAQEEGEADDEDEDERAGKAASWS